MISPCHIYKLARWFHQARVPFVPGALQRLNYFITGCDLPYDATIGARIRFQHYGAGVIVSRLTDFGDDVIVHPQVVIGQNVRGGKAVAAQRIRIGHRVQLGAGSKIITSGELQIGDDAQVGANAVVLKSVPAGATAVGIPARWKQPGIENLGAAVPSGN